MAVEETGGDVKMTEKELEMPCVHRNGTSREELLEQHEGVLELLRDLLESLAKASPNGRDYYPKGELSLNLARRQHQTRVDSVTKMITEEEQTLLYLDK